MNVCVIAELINSSVTQEVAFLQLMFAMDFRNVQIYQMNGIVSKSSKTTQNLPT